MTKQGIKNYLIIFGYSHSNDTPGLYQKESTNIYFKDMNLVIEDYCEILIHILTTDILRDLLLKVEEFK